MNAIVVQILPFLSQEHQQQVASALDRAKQVTMTELNTIIGVSARQWFSLLQRWISRRRRRREYRRRIALATRSNTPRTDSRASQREKHSRWAENPCGHATLGSRCTSEESKSGRDGYDPGESRILLNIARALNFLPIKPPASPILVSFSSSAAPFRSRRRSPPLIPRSLFLVAPSLTTYSRLFLSRSLLNLIRSLPARLPKPSGVGYSVTVHERAD